MYKCSVVVLPFSQTISRALGLLTVRVEHVWVEWIDRVRFRLRSHHRHATRVELDDIGFRWLYFSL